MFDAACLMAAEGYGGIFETCSKATQNEILGLNEALERSVDDRRALVQRSRNNAIKSNFAV